jgi:nitronate monooxygenase
MDLLGLSVRWPLVGAPMGAGPSTPALAAAVSGAGGLGFLAGAYLQAEALAHEIAETRGLGASTFGVNLFVPGEPYVDEAALRAYIETLRPEAEAFGVDLVPTWDDDDYPDKVELLVHDPVPVVSFTFGRPAPDVVLRLHQAGTQVVMTVTTPAEAAAAVDAGADALCAQGIEAGGHQGTFDDDAASATGIGTGWGLVALVRAIGHERRIPVIGAGGLMSGADVATVVGAGAVAAQLGTALLRCPESGASEMHKSALADPAFTATAITRAFSGRRARGLVNAFMVAHPDAPSAYPYINNATRSLRRAAVARHDLHATNLWCGEGFALARERPASEVIAAIGAEFDSMDA